MAIRAGILPTGNVTRVCSTCCKVLENNRIG